MHPRLVLATGAIEQPLIFANNDRPGIMLASAMREYLHRYGIAPGSQTVIATNNDSAYCASEGTQGRGCRCGGHCRLPATGARVLSSLASFLGHRSPAGIHSYRYGGLQRLTKRHSGSLIRQGLANRTRDARLLVMRLAYPAASIQRCICLLSPAASWPMTAPRARCCPSPHTRRLKSSAPPRASFKLALASAPLVTRSANGLICYMM